MESSKRPFKLIVVTGSREWVDMRPIQAVLEKHRPCRIIEGGAKGADHLARVAAHELNIPCFTCHAWWNNYPDGAAGSIRNRWMLDMQPDLVLAFPKPNSKGTRDCIAEARKRGIPVEVYEG
jgi:hypothetical protein